MIDENFTITAQCLFCGADLESDKIDLLQPGDQIKCLVCGETNDFESVIEVAKEKAVSQIESQLTDSLKSIFSK